jgi:hypothetical protein
VDVDPIMTCIQTSRPWIYYEVDTVTDVVLRTVNVFADGRIERNSIALEERNQRSSFCWNGRRMYPRNPFPTEKLQE